MISKKIFISSNVFYSYIDRKSPKYIQAEAFFGYISIHNYQLYTDIISINESANLISKNISVSLAKDFLKSIIEGNLNILYPTGTDFKESIKLISNHPNNEVTLENALIAVLCRKIRIKQICTFEYFQYFFGLQPFYLPV